MPGAETKGRGRAATYVNARKGGRIKAQFGYNSGRENLLEEVGRVRAEPTNPNRRAELSRIHGELNRGLKKGGRTGYKHSGLVAKVTGAEKGWKHGDKVLAEAAHEMAKRGEKQDSFMWKGHRIIDTPRNRKRYKD